MHDGIGPVLSTIKLFAETYLNSDNEEYALATNITLNLLFADPAIIKDPVYIADSLAPLLFNLEEEKAKDNERISELAKNLKSDFPELKKFSNSSIPKTRHILGGN